MDRPHAPGGWYPNPEGPGQRYWDGLRWTEHVRDDGGQLVQPPPRPRSRLSRALAAVFGAVATYLAVYWFRVAVEEGWGDGSFALVGYFLAACFFIAALACLRVALRPR